MVESDGVQDQIPLTADEARELLAAVVTDKLHGQTGEYYLKVGRKLARIVTTS